MSILQYIHSSLDMISMNKHHTMGSPEAMNKYSKMEGVETIYIVNRIIYGIMEKENVGFVMMTDTTSLLPFVLWVEPEPMEIPTIF